MSSQDQVVVTGFWHDHSRGNAVLGARLTLDSTKGSFLLAFLAIYITFAGSKLWTLIRFWLHQQRATLQPRPALHHQQQAVLRNTSSPISSLWLLLELFWAWRGKRRKFWSSIYLILVAAVFTFAFAAAGILSAKIAEVGGSALAQELTCGWITEQLSPGDAAATTAGGQNISDFSDANFLNYATWSSEQRQIARNSFQYARSCYPPLGDPSSPQCTAFARSYINSSLSLDVPCPFQNSSICLGQTVHVDTGLVDSNNDLGLNTPRHHNVQYRRSMTCAPIVTSDYSDWIQSDVDNFWFLQYYYNNNSNINDNTTYSMRTSDLTNEAEAAPAATYSLYSARYHWNNYTVAPIDGLLTPQADLSLILKTNVVSYIAPVNDVWFQANSSNNNTFTNDSDDWDETSAYYPDIGNVLGCATAHQLCNPNSGKCTSLTGILDLGFYSANSSSYQLNDPIDFNDDQLNVVSLLGVALLPTTVERLVLLLYDNALIANDYVADTHRFTNTFHSATLPDNQTAIEIVNWQNAGMNCLQRRFAERPRGPSSSSGFLLQQRSNLPLASQPRSFCSIQKVRNLGFTSFSVLGISLVLSIGFVFILMSLMLPYVVDRLMYRRWSFKRQEWISTHLLQLQRSVYEGFGVGGQWMGESATAVPISQGQEDFGPLTFYRRDVTIQTSEVKLSNKNAMWKPVGNWNEGSAEAIELIPRER